MLRVAWQRHRGPLAIRFPSATCGLTGLKPTWGRVSRPVFALADSLDQVGPMTRSAEDCAAILQAVAGWDASDPTSIDAPVPDYMAEIGKSIRDLGIGIDRRYALSGIHGEVAYAMSEAIEIFASLEIDFPEYEELAASWIMMCSIETALPMRRPIRHGRATMGPIPGCHSACRLSHRNWERPFACRPRVPDSDGLAPTPPRTGIGTNRRAIWREKHPH
ncbi:amidase family protein [Rhizobium azibense]|uniref:amidase family protein n=1 Tax=Rhizobium azibense TaxID=1136135 RepID=UPI00315DBB4B